MKIKVSFFFFSSQFSLLELFDPFCLVDHSFGVWCISPLLFLKIECQCISPPPPPPPFTLKESILPDVQSVIFVQVPSTGRDLKMLCHFIWMGMRLREYSLNGWSIFSMSEDFFESKLVSSSQIQQAIRIAHKVGLYISLDLDCR